MRLKQLVEVDRLSSVQDENSKGDHIVEDKALGGGWAIDDHSGQELELAFVSRLAKRKWRISTTRKSGPS